LRVRKKATSTPMIDACLSGQEFQLDEGIASLMTPHVSLLVFRASSSQICLPQGITCPPHVSRSLPGRNAEQPLCLLQMLSPHLFSLLSFSYCVLFFFTTQHKNATYYLRTNRIFYSIVQDKETKEEKRGIGLRTAR